MLRDSLHPVPCALGLSVAELAHAPLADEATWEPGVPGLFACLFDALMERQAWTGGEESRAGMTGENHPAYTTHHSLINKY